MNVYDTARELARQLSQTEEYADYARLKESAMADDTNRALLGEYKKLMFRAQAVMASGQQPSADDMDRLNKIGQLLQLNPDAGAYIAAEFRYQRMLSDIFKILAETAGVDLDALTR